ncbi:uncharacterized protein EDB93DRAFT_1242543 [Suillus bovinus]|uniref:uncharacterized protein n=1 Tax=Suillus bovinus TaxID=48563 RepID=UPI001B861267|nr:uncharacterized protein EDB93DRAFT_1242543 [Suillus bovinus]KAG2135356.1 hypothetical protein EDB93DRAFT_1242543 [Suillus bovinus]
MFSGFKKSLPQISIFHHPSSPPSIQALALLRNALSSPYPPGKQSARPLEFDLEVVETKPPTADQLKTILTYITPSRSAAPLGPSAFLSAHPATPGLGEQPQSAKSIVNLAEQNPNVFKWPVVVDWIGGRARILEAIRQQRDGEVKQDEVDQPKGWFS